MDRVAQPIEIARIQPALTRTAHSIRGGRSCLFVLSAGAAQSVEAPCLIWTPVGHTTQVAISAGARGFMMRIPESMLGRAIPTDTISGFVRQAIQRPAQASLADPAILRRLNLYFDEIETEMAEAPPGAQMVIQHCLSLMLIQTWRALRPDDDRTVTLPREIVHDFLGLVELHLQAHWTVGKYAGQLGVSKDWLTTAVRRATGHSPNQYVQKRLIEETKTLLLNSDLSVSEIAYRLGFTDTAYFNRFFQRHQKMPPGRFRAAQLKQSALPKLQSAFAAWP